MGANLEMITKDDTTGVELNTKHERQEEKKYLTPRPGLRHSDLTPLNGETRQPWGHDTESQDRHTKHRDETRPDWT